MAFYFAPVRLVMTFVSEKRWPRPAYGLGLRGVYHDMSATAGES
jgi:hypothetical protein